MLRGSARSLGQWRVPIFERKFGTDFLATVPREPGIYRMYDATGGLFYVGKARNLRRRLAQYRAARRTKKDRKRRTLVRSADRIEWQVCASLFSDQSAWARGRCRDTADRAGDPPERRRLAEEPHEERDSNCHLSRLLDGRKPLG
jgi:GIY-YIG catalytic domain-containing protein